MLVYIIEFILFVIGYMLILSLFVNLNENNELACCIGMIPGLLLGYFYGSLNNNGRLLIIAIIYGIYFLVSLNRNPGTIENIFGGLFGIMFEIIEFIIGIIAYIFGGITGLFKMKNNETDDNPITNSPENTNIQKNNQKSSDKLKIPKNKNKPKSHDNKEESHYYLDLLDINRATKEELEKVDGITKVTAQKIINLRKKGQYINSFLGLNDLLEISSAEQAKIIKQIYISDDMKKMEHKSDKVPKKQIKKYNYDKKDEKPADNYLTKSKQNIPKYKREIKKVDINKSSYSEINGIPGITSMMASQIIKLRNDGRYIESYDDLKNVLKLSSFQLGQVKDNIIITNEFKKQEKEKPKNKIKKINTNTNPNTANTKLNPIPQHKIDINQASEEELSKLNGLTVVQAKVIINLRQSGFPIKSFDDLAQKLNLNNSQIEEIKKEATIKEIERKTGGRIIDL